MRQQRIVTVTGEVRPEDLGVCQVHEHLLIMGGLITVREPRFRLSHEDEAAQELSALRDAGCDAVVEMTPIGCGRNPLGLARLERRTRVRIVACTGFHKSDYYDDLHWSHVYPAEQIADLLVRELEEGMDQLGLNGPFPEWTDVRAGVIKVATDYQHATGTQEKLFDAASMAHARTGAPIATHTEHGSFAVEQAEMLLARDVPAKSIAIGHADHNPDVGLLRDLAATGCYLQFDRQHRVEYGPDDEVLRLIVQLVDDGFGDQLLFGMDIAKREKLSSSGGGPGLPYLLTRFLPRLQGAEVDVDIDDFLVANPRRFLTWS